MTLSATLKAACLGLAALAAVALAAAPARAQEEGKRRGTVVHIKNSTSQTMTFFVEFRTADGRTRRFISGLCLEPGQEGQYSTGPAWTIPVVRRDGVPYYQIRVRGFRGETDSLRFADVEGRRPDGWWGGSASRFLGLKCKDWEEGGVTHLQATLVP